MTLLRRLLQSAHSDRAGTRTLNDWAAVVDQHQRMVATLASVRAVDFPSNRQAS